MKRGSPNTPSLARHVDELNGRGREGKKRKDSVVIIARKLAFILHSVFVIIVLLIFFSLLHRAI